MSEFALESPFEPAGDQPTAIEDLLRGIEAGMVYQTLLGVTGIGPYGANHMLVLLGHYGFVPCDSEVRAYLGLPPKTKQKKIPEPAFFRLQSSLLK